MFSAHFARIKGLLVIYIFLATVISIQTTDWKTQLSVSEQSSQANKLAKKLYRHSIRREVLLYRANLSGETEQKKESRMP